MNTDPQGPYTPPFWQDTDCDWGVIRDQNNRMIKLVVHVPEEEEQQARREKYDPYQPEVDFILNLLNAGSIDKDENPIIDSASDNNSIPAADELRNPGWSAVFAALRSSLGNFALQTLICVQNISRAV